MDTYFKKLEHYLSTRTDRISYGEKITANKLQGFEAENGIVLPEDLRMFYLWNNGVSIGDTYRVLSLQEAFQFYRDHVDYHKLQKKQGFWLPLFVGSIGHQ